MRISTEQKLLVEQRVANDGKSALVAYLLLFLVGYLGIHRFYLQKNGSAMAMLALFIMGAFAIVEPAIWLLFLCLPVLGIWLFADLFLIPGLVDRHRAVLRESLLRETDDAS